VYDKQVRRRRALLATLVACSLVLLTAYFGAAPSSPLHQVQQGIAEVFTPIQAGASKVLSPVRNLFGWVSDTIHAKSENAQLRQKNQVLLQQNDRMRYQLQQDAALLGLRRVDNVANLSQYRPVSANVIAANPQVWYDTVTVDKGSGDGIHAGDAVVGDRGLVGDVASVGSNYAVISEVTSSQFAVGAEVLDGSTHSSGVLEPAVGNPTQLQLQYLPATAPVNPGDPVITSGFRDPANPTFTSCYPPAIPIGTVSSASYNADTNSLQVEVSLAVDLRRITEVQILTRPYGSGC
jgi:rod shape-determining protein MreC